jgi:hypothetical protein
MRVLVTVGVLMRFVSLAALKISYQKTATYYKGFQLPGKALHISATRLFGSYSATHIVQMPRGVKKENLPQKVCIVCNRPFTWRKKWEKVWEEVTTCSKSCNRQRREARSSSIRVRSSGDVESLESDDEGMEGVEEEACSTINAMPNSSSPTPTFREERASETLEDSISQIEFFAQSSTHSRIENDIQAYDTDTRDVEALSELLEAAQLDENSDGEGKDDANDDNDSDKGMNESEDVSQLTPKELEKKLRKERKKEAKAMKRAKREGKLKDVGRKPCDLCTKQVDLLVRCTVDSTRDWKMVCGKCWNTVSGGVVDGDAAHPHYNYGGLWKNRSRK